MLDKFHPKQVWEQKRGYGKETIMTSMTNGEEVFLRGFGSFIIKHRADKTARNISKNTTVIIPAHDIPAFRPAKEFMDQVKG